jgi:hypothetical protein
LSTPDANIPDILTEFKDNTKAIKEDLLRICWFMRGGIGYNESHMLTIDERKLIYDIIESNLKTTKETQMPFF